MTFFSNPSFHGHESIHQFHDPATGLKAIIAIHSTALGPAAGGCRRWIYASEEDAITDALRLSRGMSYKNAMAGLPMGGGKGVIMAGVESAPDEALYASFGRFVDSLGGRYITAEDVGVSIDNMRTVKEVTNYVAGLPHSHGSAGGDPSPWTADGVFMGLQAAVQHRLSLESVKGLTVAVQGVGKVGYDLCRQLHAAGASLIISDVNQNNVARAHKDFGAEVVAPEQILFQHADVLAPCALGAVFNDESIPQINAKVIAGAANNQLAELRNGQQIKDRNILYVPDYVINAGGIISVSLEYMGDKTAADTKAQIDLIPERLTKLFKSADKLDQPTNVVADAMAESIIASGKSSRSTQH
jgi:leucine dehydrogenase